MRKVIACALVCSACGTWSNEDLEYLYALPDKATLHAVAPGESSAMQGLSRQGLSVGDPSETYANTKQMTDTFNHYMDGVLNLVDDIRQFPPTTRAPNARIWGPWNDTDHPGFQWELEVDRDGGHEYDWAIRSRQLGSDFFDFAAGHSTTTMTLKQGVGGFFLDAKTYREHFDAGSPDDPDTATFTYVTDQSPKRVDMTLVKEQVASLGYAYSENDAGQVHADFTITGTDPNVTKLACNVAWDNSGQGRADLKVLEGNYAQYDAGFFECWDSAQKVVFSNEIFDGGAAVGLPGACVMIPEF